MGQQVVLENKSNNGEYMICIILYWFMFVYTHSLNIVVKGTYFYILHANSENIHTNSSESLVSLRAVSIAMKLLKHQSTLSPADASPLFSTCTCHGLVTWSTSPAEAAADVPHVAVRPSAAAAAAPVSAVSEGFAGAADAGGSRYEADACAEWRG